MVSAAEDAVLRKGRVTARGWGDADVNGEAKRARLHTRSVVREGEGGRLTRGSTDGLLKRDTSQARRPVPEPTRVAPFVRNAQERQKVSWWPPGAGGGDEE